MLKYINEQLSEKEEHDIQKHLIDCDFCTEALEGIKYANNSSVLFAIDHKIDSIVAKKKTPLLKNLMLAASVLIILFGAYFSYLTFNSVISKNESNISLNTTSPNTVNKILEEIIPAIEEKETRESEFEITQQESIIEVEKTNEFVRPIEEQNRKLNETDKIVLEDEIEKFEPASIIANAEMMDFEVKEELAEKEIDTKTAEETLTLSATGNTATNKDNLPLKLDKTYKIEGNKKREKQKSFAPSPIKKERAITTDQDENLAGGVIDSKNEDATILENTGYISTEVIANDDAFADDAEPEASNSSLDKGITLYEQKKYQQAIKYLNIELLTKTTLNKSKTQWYKALCLIELNKIEDAKVSLNQIITNNDEYLNEAKSKLAELE